MPLRTPTRIASPGAALFATVIVSFAVYATLAHFASVPRFFFDELYYMETAVSVGQGDGLNFHGEPWGYGPLYPLLVGALVWLTPDQDLTYELAKLVNALAFSLAAVPVYLLARRLLPPWPSAGVAALSAALPSSMYVSVVMTESVGYLFAVWSLYGVALVLERPTVGRQLGALAAIGAAIATRPQLVAVAAGYVVALVALAVADASYRARLRAAPASLWPTAAAIVAGLAWLARPLVRGEGVGDAFGDYSVLARSYDPLAVAQWFAYHIGELALYLAVIPVAVAPAVLSRLWQRGRAGDMRAASFLALFVSMNVLGIGLIAAFASTEFGLGLLYDRYLFYLVPLWLVVFTVWLRAGLPRPVVPLTVGVAAVTLLVATLPFHVIGEDHWFRQFQAVATEVWGKVGLVAERVPLLSVRAAGVLFAVTLVAATVLVPRRRAWVLPAAIALLLGANLSLAWRSAYVDPATYGASARGTRSWVDDRLGDAADATVLVVARPCNREPERFSARLTDFFNRSVQREVYVGGESGAGGPTALRVRGDGSLVHLSGQPLLARYLVAQPGIELRGEPLAAGMATRLVLWETGGQVRVENARSNRELLRSGCTAGSG